MEQIRSSLAACTTIIEPTLSEVFAHRTRGYFNDEGTWTFVLPDAIESLRAEFTDSLDTHQDYRLHTTAQRLFPDNELIASLPYDFIILNDEHYFVPGLALTPERKEVAVVWLHLAAIDALSLVEALRQKDVFESFALFGNAVINAGAVSGLGHLAHIQMVPAFGCLCFLNLKNPLSDAEQFDTTQFANLCETSEAFATENAPCLPQSALLFLKHIFEGNDDTAEQSLASDSASWKTSAGASFAAGTYLSRQRRHSQAAQWFNTAQRLLHPAALRHEWDTLSRLTKPFREEFSEAFDHIRRGEKFRALTILRQAAKEHPLTGNAVLSYCLRGAGVPEEGLNASIESLKHNPRQADVLSNKWTYEIELGKDHDALQTARQHARYYPNDPNAWINLLDALLLTGNTEQASIVVWRYHTIAPRVERALEQFFKVAEQNDSWSEAAYVFNRYVPHVRGPTVRTLTYYGEVLLEVEQFEEAFKQFERALAAEPGDAQLITAYARGLARADREAEAESLLRTVLADPKRVDAIDNRAFIVTMLAEILRRTGRPDEALVVFEENLPENLVELSQKVGPAPCIEYIESLLALGHSEAAKSTSLALHTLWPEDPFVHEIREVVQREA